MPDGYGPSSSGISAGSPRVSESGAHGKAPQAGVCWHHVFVLTSPPRPLSNAARLLGLLTLVLTAVAALVDTVGVRRLNDGALPRALPIMARVLDRDLRVARVTRLNLFGLAGVGPVVSLEGVCVGPRWSGAECSSAAVDQIHVHVAPLASLRRRRVAIGIRVRGVSADLRQCSNYSWFGYPLDTPEGAQDFVPGLAAAARAATHASASSSFSSPSAPAAVPTADRPAPPSSPAALASSEYVIPDPTRQPPEASSRQQWGLGDPAHRRTPPVGPPVASISVARSRVVCRGLRGVRGGAGVSELAQVAAAGDDKSGGNGGQLGRDRTATNRGLRSRLTGMFRLRLAERQRGSPSADRAAVALASTPETTTAAEQAVVLGTVRLPRGGRGRRASGSGSAAQEPSARETSNPATSGVREPRRRSQSGKRRRKMADGVASTNASKASTSATSAEACRPGPKSGALASAPVVPEPAEASATPTSFPARTSSADGAVDVASADVSVRHRPAIAGTTALGLQLTAAAGTQQTPTASAGIETHPPTSHGESSAGIGSSSPETPAPADVGTPVGSPPPTPSAEVRVDDGIALDPGSVGDRIVQVARRAPQLEQGIEMQRRKLRVVLSWLQSWLHERTEVGTEVVTAPHREVRASPAAAAGARRHALGRSMNDTSPTTSARGLLRTLEDFDSPLDRIRLHRSNDTAHSRITAPHIDDEPVGPGPKPVTASGRVSAKLTQWLIGLLPPIKAELATVDVADSTVRFYVVNETAPRHLNKLRGRVALGKGYHSLSIDLESEPGVRDQAEIKTTMVMPTSKRHLRFTLPTAVSRLPYEMSGRESESHASARGPLADYELPRTFDGGTALALAQPGPQSATTKSKSFISMKLRCHDLLVPNELAKLSVKLKAHNLDAPMIERVLELPMDIHQGTISGNLEIKAYDHDTWAMPLLIGRLSATDADFHFWDAPDDMLNCRMDLLFEGKRLYFHNARGYYGAIPVYVTGDMDLNPETGQYRLSAESPGVEINALRCTLGVRPTPFPAAGAVKGMIHVTGPLEKPVFSGTALTMAPTPEMLSSSPSSWAQDLLVATPGAVAAYDKVPLSRASVVFTVDTASEMMYLHAVHAEPCAGGYVNAAGRMWVAPEAEDHPQAVQIHAEANYLPTEQLMLGYLPPGSIVPPVARLGHANAKVSMKGSHLDPIIDVDWEAPASQATGKLRLADNVSASLRSSTIDFDAHIKTAKIGKDIVQAAVTQEEAFWAAQPLVCSLDVTTKLKNLDLTPHAAASGGERHSRDRIRLSGSTRVRGDVLYQTEAGHKPSSHETLLSKFVVSAPDITAEQLYRPPGTPSPAQAKWAPRRLVAGPRGSSITPLLKAALNLDGLRINKLDIARSLSGTLSLSSEGASIDARGRRKDEILKVAVSPEWLGLRKPPAVVPDELYPAPAAEDMGAVPAAPLGSMTAQADATAEQLLTGGRFRVLSLPGCSLFANAQVVSHGPAFVPQPARCASSPTPVAEPKPVSRDSPRDLPSPSPTKRDGGALSLRQGALRLDLSLNDATSRVKFLLENLVLDDLELGSLRGRVNEVGLDLDFEGKLGRGKVEVHRPRFSGLLGEALSGTLRWERNILRLERSALQQVKSRYELTAEYIIPTELTLPDSLSDLTALSKTAGGADAPLGLWRAQVNVPRAELAEILPAARLLSQAAAVRPVDYDRAKEAFLEGLSRVGISSDDLRSQIEQVRQRSRLDGRGARGASSSDDAADGVASVSPLLGLQELTGQWKGQIRAYGGDGGASATDFDLTGTDWRLGEFAMDSAVARGRVHSIDGWEVDELSLGAGCSSFQLTGALLGPVQRAEFKVKEFPAAWAEAMIKAVSSLKSGTSLAAPSAPKDGGKDGAKSALLSPSQLRGLFERLPFVPAASATPDVPTGSFGGLVFVDGRLGGSKEVPSGRIRASVMNGSVGDTLLRTAELTADVDSDQRLNFKMRATPLDNPGHVKVDGSLPLRDPEPKQDGLLQRFRAPVQRLAAGGRDPAAIEVEAGVKDSGMALLTALVPQVTWEDGMAQISVAVRGTLKEPIVEGFAEIDEGVIKCPLIKGDLDRVQASISLRDSTVDIQSLTAQTGREPGRFLLPWSQRQGIINIKGRLPLFQRNGRSPWSTLSGGDGISVNVSGLPLTVKSLYNGMLEAAVRVTGSLQAPVVGGEVQATRGTITLSPPPGGSGSSSYDAPEDAVQAGLTNFYAAAMDRLQVDGASTSAESAAPPVIFNALRIRLGPELTATYPLVLRFQLGGDIVVNGRAMPELLRPSGAIYFDGGEVNLVATQLSLDRSHSNRVIFTEEQGLDPTIDMSFLGEANQLVYTIQGRASRWQDNIIINRGGSMDPSDRLNPKEAAQVFASQLEAQIFHRDGRLALPSLVPTAYSIAPRIEVRGEFGKTRYRLVSMAFTPSWFSLDPSAAGQRGDLSAMDNLLSAIGTEVDVFMGRSLQASVSRRPTENLVYRLLWRFSPQLRLQISSARDSVPRLVMEFGDERSGGPFGPIASSDGQSERL